MRDQLEMLADRPWNTLMVLDTARYDFTRDACPGVVVEKAVSPAGETRGWLEAAVPALAAAGVDVYYSAQPVATSKLRQMWAPFHLVDLSERLWGFYAGGIPSVHPHALAGAVRVLAHEGERRVVHFLTPHYPYVGAPALDTRRSSQHLAWPLSMNRRDAVTGQEMREPYAAALRLTLEAARNLAAWLGGLTAVTADHGELLGEDGLVGHEQEHDLLREVPWLEISAPADGVGADASLRARLEALGYA